MNGCGAVGTKPAPSCSCCRLSTLSPPVLGCFYTECGGTDAFLWHITPSLTHFIPSTRCSQSYPVQAVGMVSRGERLAAVTAVPVGSGTLPAFPGISHPLDTLQVVIETDTSSYAFRLMSFDDLEQVVVHVTMSLKKVFPDSSPG